jgi:hypothetical protein
MRKSRIIQLDLDDIVGLSRDEFLDLVSERAFGTLLALEIEWFVLGTNNGMVILDVHGDVEMAFSIERNGERRNGERK